MLQIFKSLLTFMLLFGLFAVNIINFFIVSIHLIKGHDGGIYKFLISSLLLILFIGAIHIMALHY